MARLAALKAFIQWASRMGVVRGSRTREERLPVNRGASAAATPPPVSPVEPPVRGAVEPRPAAGVPSPATVSPSHVCTAEVAAAAGEPPSSETAAGGVGGGGGGGLALVALPRPNRSLGGG